MKEEVSIGKKIALFIIGIFIILGMLIVSEFPSVLLTLFQPIFNKKQNGVSFILFMCWLIVLVGVIWFIWRYYKKKSHDIDTSVTGKDIWRAFKIFLLGRVIAIVGTGLMQQFYGTGSSANDEAIAALFSQDESIYYVLIMTITIAIKAPILEELIFRGLPTTLLFPKMPVWVPMIVTSLVFSSVHLSSNIISFGMYASLGALMYGAYSSRGRIIDSMLVHFMNNIMGAIVLLLSYLFGLSI
ncbi:type II CAAX endopeptidase family protein [Vagococcus sp. CY53-2]|uniref:CPBP family intramembrane glutamic endopeptidase n=1 Tax=Vagococcus sp. CY53-2 TaxID=2925780 RepID=UPI001F50AB25|nr:type II CAAX endopeptidase family protein [Vagococcus sp. CY53-2]MCI0129975.1 CPBP family intramembrane metalloprotease [Vagococcus sp. CY53-2]